jgi:hypothetical protein
MSFKLTGYNFPQIEFMLPWKRCEVKSSLCLTKYHAMETGGIDPHIHNLGTADF